MITTTIAYCSLNVLTDEIQTIATFDLKADTGQFTPLEQDPTFITIFNVPAGILGILEWNSMTAAGVTQLESSAFLLELDGGGLVVTRKAHLLDYPTNSKYRNSNYFHDASNGAIVWVGKENNEGSNDYFMHSFDYDTFTMDAFPIVGEFDINEYNFEVSHSNEAQIIFMAPSWDSEAGRTPAKLYYVPRDYDTNERYFDVIPALPNHFFGVGEDGNFYFDIGVGISGNGEIEFAHPDNFNSNNISSVKYEPPKTNLRSYGRAIGID